MTESTDQRRRLGVLLALALSLACSSTLGFGPKPLSASGVAQTAPMPDAQAMWSDARASLQRHDLPAEARLRLQLYDLINQYRAEQGLYPLALDARLNASAMAHSRDMTRMGGCRHSGSDGSSSRNRMAVAGYPYNNWAGENIICARDTAEAALAWWKTSTPHRKNLLHRHFSHIGIGFDPDGPWGGMWTLNFAAGADTTNRPVLFGAAQADVEAPLPADPEALQNEVSSFDEAQPVDPIHAADPEPAPVEEDDSPAASEVGAPDETAGQLGSEEETVGTAEHRGTSPDADDTDEVPLAKLEGAALESDQRAALTTSTVDASPAVSLTVNLGESAAGSLSTVNEAPAPETSYESGGTVGQTESGSLSSSSVTKRLHFVGALALAPTALALPTRRSPVGHKPLHSIQAR